jgi:hypothetical protein
MRASAHDCVDLNFQKELCFLTNVAMRPKVIAVRNEKMLCVLVARRPKKK